MDGLSPAVSEDALIAAQARTNGNANDRRQAERLHASLVALLQTVGERALVLHAPRGSESGLGGSDFDCAVENLDPAWPLRLSSGWRLCQCFHYDLRGWYSIIEAGGDVIALDLIDDPTGLGRDGVSTAALAKGEGLYASAAIEAAYLAVKRVRKGILTQDEWAGIGRLAREDSARFVEVLERSAGPRLATLLGPPAFGGRAPDEITARRARRVLFARRFGSPARALRALALGGRRYFERVGHPSGLLVVVAGPDGSGKSTLADSLPNLCAGLFRRNAHLHWRPGLLPAPAALIGSKGSDPTRPHDRAPHGKALSTLLLGYYWLDFVVGGLLRIRWSRVRSGLVVVERGWWDIVVDPHRYRLDVPAWLIRALGSLVQRPDLALVLDAPPSVLLERKAELTGEELARQSAEWRKVERTASRVVYLDGSRSIDEIAHRAREEILVQLERRAVSRLGQGWAQLPTRNSSRWWLPRGPRRAARSSLKIYQPTAIRSRVAWEAAHLLAAVGGGRLFPRGEAPPRLVREALAPHLPPRSTFAVMKVRGEGRYVALIIDRLDDCHVVAKIATDESGALALQREADLIESLGPKLKLPLRPPRIVGREQGLLLMEAVDWHPALRPWRLDEEIVRVLGAFFRAGKREEGSDVVGPAHGDCAPWNLLRGRDGGVLVDWEDASETHPPFYDLCHYLVQSHALLGRPTRNELLRGYLRGRGWIGELIRAYAEEADVPPDDASRYLHSYLRISHRLIVTRPPHAPTELAARKLLFESTEGFGATRP